MTAFIAGYSGLFSTGENGTEKIASKLDARHYEHPLGLANAREYAEIILQAQPSFIALFGHSEGADTILEIAQELDKFGIEVDYLGIIDLRLVPKGKAGGNIKLMQEFHSAYAQVKKLPSFKGDHQFFNLDDIAGRNVSHTGAVRLAFTQDTIVNTIQQLQGSEPMDEKPFYIGEYNPLTDSELIGVATRFGYAESRIRAIFEIESAGRGSESSGALRHLYEPHVMWRNLKSGVNLDIREALRKEGHAYPDWRPGTYPATPYPRTDEVVEIIAGIHPAGMAGAVELTALACSWGLGQVLGENARSSGYDSATDMVNKFKQSELAQLIGMVQFIEGANLRNALLNGDWTPFAIGYNGSQQHRHNYDGRLKASDAKWASRIASRGPHEDILEIPEDRDPDEWVWQRDTGDVNTMPDIVPEEDDDNAIVTKQVMLGEVETYIRMHMPNVDKVALDIFLIRYLMTNQDIMPPPDPITEELEALVKPQENNMNKILDLLPFNGNKTNVGLIAFAIASILVDQGTMIPDWVFTLIYTWTGIGVGHKLDKASK